jgi:hypothetical protein
MNSYIPQTVIAICTIMTDKPPLIEGHPCMKYDGKHIELFSKADIERAKRKYKEGDIYNGYTITNVSIHDDLKIGTL